MEFCFHPEHVWIYTVELWRKSRLGLLFGLLAFVHQTTFGGMLMGLELPWSRSGWGLVLHYVAFAAMLALYFNQQRAKRRSHEIPSSDEEKAA